MQNNNDETDNRAQLLKQIKEEVLNLKTSPLYVERIKNKVFPVIGEGDHFAKIMFIGEAPGKNEAATGKPFCGASGRVLDELLASIAINRSSVYVTNIVKDRPPSNRDPLPEEIQIYAPFLDRQIEIIQPKIIATLGRFSMNYIMEKFGLDFEIEPISKIHGKIFKSDIVSTYIDTEKDSSPKPVLIIPFYHPASALYGGTSKQLLIEDFKVLKDLV